MPDVFIDVEEAVPGDFFDDPDDIAKVPELLDSFRRRIGDHRKRRNILDLQEFTFEDGEIYGFIKDAINDINSGVPKTAFKISNINDDAFVVTGAMVIALVSKGILEVKNSLNFGDQGLSINTYDKGPNYQAWASMLANDYVNLKAQYKGREAYRNMFCGVASDYSRIY